MKTKNLPLQLENTWFSLYGNVGERLAAGLLDGLFLVPFSIGVLFFNSQQLHNYYYTFFVMQVVIAVYYIYLPVRYGATPGKRVMGLTILTIEGSAISYRESFLKYAPLLLMGWFAFVVQCLCISNADEARFSSLSWIEQANYLKSLSPVPFWLQMTIIYGYYLGTIILLLTDKRKRSLSDQLAGTVVVYTRILDKIADYKIERNSGESAQ